MSGPRRERDRETVAETAIMLDSVVIDAVATTGGKARPRPPGTRRAFEEIIRIAVEDVPD